MVDWWQAFLLLAAGALLGLAATYVQRRWSRSDTLEAAQREHRYKVAEERREAVRRHRRERVQAILDFLMLAKQYRAQKEIEQVAHRDDGWDWQSMGLPALDDEHVTHAGLVAMASAPTQQLYNAVMEAWWAVTDKEKSPEALRKAVAAIRLVDNLVERYITEVSEEVAAGHAEVVERER
jgi:hypothetical protein